MASKIKVDELETVSGSGVITVNQPLSGSGASLTSLPAANLTGTLPAISGANLTGITTGKVLQVIQTHLITASSQSLSVASTVYEISGLTATITPSATTSKIMVDVKWSGELSNAGYLQALVFGLKRDTTQIGQPAAAGSRTIGISGPASGYSEADNNSTQDSATYSYLDSPSSTSALAYKATILLADGITGTLYNQRTVGDTDANHIERLTSTITLWEIGA
jgi:hypothetical protein